MDALMPAIVVALLAHVTDRSARAAAALTMRTGKPVAVIVGALTAQIVVNAMAAIAGAWVGPKLSPEAQALLLALSLLLAGGSSVLAAKPPKLADPRTGAGFGALFTLLALGFGDRMQFVTFALAARTTIPALPAIGATLGAMVVIAGATLVGEKDYARTQISVVRIAISVLLILAGLAIGLRALRLV